MQSDAIALHVVSITFTCVHSNSQVKKLKFATAFELGDFLDASASESGGSGMPELKDFKESINKRLDELEATVKKLERAAKADDALSQSGAASDEDSDQDSDDSVDDDNESSSESSVSSSSSEKPKKRKRNKKAAVKSKSRKSKKERK